MSIEFDNLVIIHRNDKRKPSDNPGNQQVVFHTDLSSAYGGPSPIEPIRDSTYNTIGGDLIDLRNTQAKENTDNNTN